MKRSYHRDSNVSNTEITLIMMILFHNSGCRCLKHFYLVKQSFQYYNTNHSPPYARKHMKTKRRRSVFYNQPCTAAYMTYCLS